MTKVKNILARLFGYSYSNQFESDVTLSAASMSEVGAMKCV